MELLNEPMDIEGRCQWVLSNEFYCCGYLFKIALGSKRFKICAGVKFVSAATPGLAIESSAFVELEKVEFLSVKGNGVTQSLGCVTDGMCSLGSFRFLVNAFSIPNPLPAGTLLSQFLTQAGYARETQVHLTAKVAIRLASARSS